MKRKNRKDFSPERCQEGFMLLEILLALALLSLLLAATYSFYFLGLTTYKEGCHLIDLQQNARISADKINREIKWAKSYLIYPGGSHIDFYFPNDNRRYSFRVRNRDLDFILGTSVTKVACNIESVRFSTQAPNLITYTIVAGKGENKYEVSSSVHLRNGGN